MKGGGVEAAEEEEGPTHRQAGRKTDKQRQRGRQRNR